MKMSLRSVPFLAQHAVTGPIRVSDNFEAYGTSYAGSGVGINAGENWNGSSVIYFVLLVSDNFESYGTGYVGNGTNINAGCGAVHPEGMAEAVRAHGADLGIALDGDADRVIVADEKGRVVDGDAIMAIVARDLLRRGRLRQETVVATVMSNVGLERSMAELGGAVVRTQVGDRYILERMLNKGYNLGGEQSGHLIFLDHTTTGDGILSALQVLAVMKKKGRPLSELAAVMTTLPQVLVNVTVERRRELDSIPIIRKAIADAEKKLAGKGRVLVRFSGTQALCRVMIEGPSQKEITAMANGLAEVIRKIGITEQTYYRWRKEYGGMKVSQARRLKELEQENSRLKRAIADLTLDKLILREALEGNY